MASRRIYSGRVSLEVRWFVEGLGGWGERVFTWTGTLAYLSLWAYLFVGETRPIIAPKKGVRQDEWGGGDNGMGYESVSVGLHRMAPSVP